MAEPTDFVSGWNEALDAVAARLSLIKLDLDKEGKKNPWDVYLDFQNAIKEVREAVT